MHDYSIDRHPKDKILFGLAFLAISGAPVLNSAIAVVVTTLNGWSGWSFPALTAIPVFALFGAVYWIFNKHLWRVKLFRSFLLIPDLNGVWVVSGKTVLKNGESADYTWDGTIAITQSWSQLSICLDTQNSKSKSLSASIHHDPSSGYRLLYQYENAPSAEKVELKKHSGAVELLFDLDCATATGHYFTDQHRNTVGTMRLRRTADGNQ